MSMVYLKSMMKKMKITEAEYANNHTFSNLPFDLKLLIMSHLSTKDNIRASAVCKTWHKACVSVRVKDPTPWLITCRLPDEEDEYELYDPSLSKTYIHEYPEELRGSYRLHSTDGWLLMHHLYQRETFFFNPFTHDCIQMPCSEYFGNSYGIAFSCAPTSKSCVLFKICYTFKRLITIKTCRVSTQECTTFTFPEKLPFDHGGFKQVVFSNGVFYCLNNLGNLGMFDLSTSSWDLLPEWPHHKGMRPNKLFLTEYLGDIYLIYLYEYNLRPRTYLKLDLINRRWMEKTKISLAGLTFYLSFNSTLTTRNDLSMCTTQGMQLCHLHKIWIKPPATASDMFTS